MGYLLSCPIDDSLFNAYNINLDGRYIIVYLHLSATAEHNAATTASNQNNQEQDAIEDPLSKDLPVSEVIEELSTVEICGCVSFVLSKTAEVSRVCVDCDTGVAFFHLEDPHIAW